MSKKFIEVGRLEISEIKVYSKTDDKNAILIKIEPSIEGVALEALLRSTDMEIKDGKLVSFK